jgi:serine/threonine-protein kinase
MRWLFLLVVSCALLVPARAFAQTRDPAAAEVLFHQAKKLMDDQKYTEACPKFAESHRLDPGVGVLLYLGDCYEKLGRVASAWAAYREAAPAARQLGQEDRERIATERAQKLEPRLPWLTVEVPPQSAISGLEIRRDEVLLRNTLWGSEVPVDPGEHTIAASAPGRRPWSTRVSLREGQHQQVVVPLLDAEGAAPSQPSAQPTPVVTPDPPDQPSERSGFGAQHAIAIAAAGLGVAGVVVGAVFGVKTMDDWSEAKEHCDESAPRRCDDTGVELAASAKQSGLVSTIAFAVGGAALAAGVILWFTAPSLSDEESAVYIAPGAAPGAAFLVVGGSL